MENELIDCEAILRENELNKEKYLIRIVERVLAWSEQKATKEDIAELVLSELINYDN